MFYYVQPLELDVAMDQWYNQTFVRVMAETKVHTELYSVELSQLNTGELGLKCENCALMQKQLHTVLLELKSAETIISLLREEGKSNYLGSPADRLCSVSLCATSEGVISASEHNREKWSTVVCRNNKMKVTCDTNITNVRNLLVSTNKFAPLMTVTENHEEITDHESNYIRSQPTNPKTVTTTQYSIGRKIPTIVNGRSFNNFNNSSDN